MHEQSAEALRDAGLAFLGKMVAIQSHEATNAFSVINEMAGLQGDILEDAARGRNIDLLEIEDTCKKIREHVQRGQDAIKSINWIAHTVDQLNETIDLAEALKKAVAVANHWLQMRRAHVRLDTPTPGVHLETRPFFLAFAVLLSADAVAQKSTGEQTVTIGFSKLDAGVDITIEGTAEPKPKADWESPLSTLKALMKSMGGQVKPSRPHASSANRVIFWIPKDAKRGNNGGCRG
jgi:hypothetical protein